MSEIERPVTVAELRSMLDRFDPDDVVMIECADHFYSGPVVLDNLRSGDAALFTSDNKKEQYWAPLDRDDGTWIGHEPAGLPRKKALIIWTE